METFNGVAFEFVTDVEVLDYSLITAYADPMVGDLFNKVQT